MSLVFNKIYAGHANEYRGRQNLILLVNVIKFITISPALYSFNHAYLFDVL